MNTFRRLITEFWGPAAFATAWTLWVVYTPNWQSELKAIVTMWGGSFFLASWATGQFFRVRKQAAVERNLTSIEVRVETLVATLERHTKDFIGHTTGADSWASFWPMLEVASETLELNLSNASAYPVFDVYADLIDLDEPIAVGRTWTQHVFTLPSLYPKQYSFGAYRLNLAGRDRLRVNISIQTRSLRGVQKIRVARVNGDFRVAQMSQVGEKPSEYIVPADYPGFDPGNPDAIFQMAAAPAGPAPTQANASAPRP